MADEFIKKYRKAVKESKNNNEIDTALNKLYEDGFQDGINDKEEK